MNEQNNNRPSDNLSKIVEALRKGLVYHGAKSFEEYGFSLQTMGMAGDEVLIVDMMLGRDGVLVVPEQDLDGKVGYVSRFTDYSTTNDKVIVNIKHNSLRAHPKDKLQDQIVLTKSEFNGLNKAYKKGLHGGKSIISVYTKSNDISGLIALDVRKD